METTIWLLNEITKIFGSAIWSFFANGAFYGLVGLIWGVILVIILNKRKIFNRTNKVWTFFAKINLFYIPVLFSILFGVYASVFSLQNKIDNWIKGSVDSIQNYSASYIPEVEKIANQLLASADKTEKALKAKVIEGSGLSKYSMGQTFYYSFNRYIISYMLSKYGYTDDITGITSMVKEKQLKQLNASFFGGITTTIQKDFTSKYFNIIYTNLFWIFFPFVFVPIGEFVFFFFYQKSVLKKANDSTGNQS